jgi:hypothetical protein
VGLAPHHGGMGEEARNLTDFNKPNKIVNLCYSSN